MRAALLITVVVLVCVLLLAVVRQRVREAEGFTLAKDAHGSLRSAFLSSACTELSSPDLQGNALVKAKEHIDTQRLRRWKPLDGTRVDGNTYCYAMHSADGLGPSDYFMAGRRCDKSDPAFATVPFIRRVFEDTGAQTVNVMGQRKCVMEIDSSAVQPQALQAFWDQAAETECTRKNQSLLDLRTRLRRDLEDQRQLRTQVQLLVRNQLAELDELARDIAGLRGRQAEAWQDEDRSQQAYDTRLQRVHDLKSAYAASDAEKKTHLSVSSKAHQACGKERQRLESEVGSKQAEMGQLAQELQALQEVYDNQSKDLASEETTSQRLTAAYNSVSNRLDTTSADLAKCQQESLECQEKLGVCKGQLDKLAGVKAQLDKDFVTVSTDLSQCRKFQASERQELNRLSDLDQRLQRDAAILSRQEAEAQRELKRQEARLRSLLAELEELKKLKTSCEQYDAQLEALKAELLKHKKRCSNLQQRVDSMRKDALADQVIRDLRAKDEKCVEKPPPHDSFYNLVATAVLGNAYLPKPGHHTVQWAREIKFRASEV